MSESDEKQHERNAAALTPKQTQQLNDEELQEKYRRAYLEQLRRRACPGCGETDVY